MLGIILSRKKIADNVLAAAICSLLLFGVPFLERQTGKVAPPPVSGQMALHVFDVGQGDAILAQEGDRQILIDGGPDASVLERLGEAMPADDRTIDLVVLTHPHSDHLNGLVAVLERYEVVRIMATDAAAPTSNFRRWKEVIAKKGIPVDDPQVTKEENVADMSYEVLAYGTAADAIRRKHDGNSDGLNDTSIVGVLRFGTRRFLMMGDATAAVEETLLAAQPALKADFIKVGHHGSAYSTGGGFFAAVAPSYAAISVGAKNSYGNPAWRVLKLIEKAATTSYRTDRDGTVTALTDGTSLQVRAEKVL